MARGSGKQGRRGNQRYEEKSRKVFHVYTPFDMDAIGVERHMAGHF